MAEVNKSILVIDTPIRCYDCPSYKGSIRGDMCCVAEKTLTTSELFNTTKKPDWCPLKEIPEKFDNLEQYSYKEMLDADRVFGFENGWNECVDVILEEDYE